MTTTPSPTPPAAPSPRRRSTDSLPGEKPTTIYQAILAASTNFGSLEKDADNPYFRSKYLSLGALLNAVRPALTDEGIIISSRFELLPQGWVVSTRLIHLPTGEEMVSQFPVVDVTNSQKVGASGTFGMRYNLLQLLGIAAADDDGNSASSLPPPDDFLGPVPTGQQRTEPQRLPTGDPFGYPPGVGGLDGPPHGTWL